MAYEQNPNSGSLFKNTRKNAPNQPDYEGNALIDGVQKRIAAWIKTSKNGTTYMSLAFSDPQPVQQNAPQYNPRGMQQTGQMPSAPLGGGDMPDSIPF